MAENMIKFGKNLVLKDELVGPGYNFCGGCGEALALRLAMKAIGKDCVIVNATGCCEVVTTPYPFTAWQVPWIHTLFDNTAAVASGVKDGLDMMMKKGRIEQRDIKVVAVGGDGSTADIGFQALSGALERGHDFTYICWDNEAYMNTGVQRSSATPWGASTTTAPAGSHSIGEKQPKKDMVGIAVAHGIPYAATANISHPFDLMNKVKKAIDTKGPAYVHILASCCTGWRHPAETTIELSRLAVETGYFPLYEVEDGKYKFTVEVKKYKPIEEFIKPQGRFRHLKADDYKYIQEQVDKNLARLQKLASD